MNLPSSEPSALHEGAAHASDTADATHDAEAVRAADSAHVGDARARVDTTAERRTWLSLLARATRAELDAALDAVFATSPRPAYDWLRVPETGLAMVRARMGGTGDAFNTGEATVTRAVLRLKAAAGTSPAAASPAAGTSPSGPSPAATSPADASPTGASPPSTSPAGVAYQLGRDKRRAELAALCDALLQTEAHAAPIRAHLLVPVSRRLATRREAQRADAAGTRVEFFTMVRGES